MPLLVAGGGIALGYYFSWWFIGDRLHSPLMWAWLIGAAMYAGVQVLGNWILYLVARRSEEAPKPPGDLAVDVFVTAYREPYAMIEHTLAAACAMRGNHRTWLLDDGRDPALSALAERYGSGYLTRSDHQGAKAGNLNAALRRTSGDVIVILDCDHTPEPDFLEKSLGYFQDPKIGFVQVMITFGNAAESWVAKAAMETSLEFYNPTYLGANVIGGATMMGSNALIRRAALEGIGGYQAGLAEDLATSIALHAAGWKSAYVAEPLAPGQAPPSFIAWFIQQMKWARGVFELLITVLPRVFRKLTWGQRLSYAVRMTKYWIGPAIGLHLFATIAVLIYASGPFLQAFHEYLIRLTPLVLCDVLIRFVALRTWQHPSTPKTSLVRAVALIYATWPIYLVAWIMAILRLPLSFRSTPKSSGKLNPFWLLPQATTILLLIVGTFFTVFVGGHRLSVLLFFATLQGCLQLIILAQWLITELRLTEGIPGYLVAVKNLFPSVGVVRREVNGRLRTYITDLPFTIDPLPLDGVEKAITTIHGAWQLGKQIFIYGEGEMATLAGLFARDLARDLPPGPRRVFRVRTTRFPSEAAQGKKVERQHQDISVLELPNLIRQGDVLVGIALDEKRAGIFAGVHHAQNVKAKTILITGGPKDQESTKVDVLVDIPGDTLERVEDGILVFQHIVSKALREMGQREELAQAGEGAPDLPAPELFTSSESREQIPAQVATSEKAKRILESLSELDRADQSEFRPDYYLRKGLEISLDVFNAASGSLVVFGGFGTPMRAAIAYEGTVRIYPADHLIDTLQSGLAGWVAANREPALVIDTHRDTRWLRRSWEERTGSRSAISTPILAKGLLLGVLTLVHPTPGHFGASDLTLLAAYGASIAQYLGFPSAVLSS
jgi:cellulose synthase (UDP-forming)